jgi:hypothetical protein
MSFREIRATHRPRQLVPKGNLCKLIFETKLPVKRGEVLEWNKMLPHSPGRQLPDAQITVRFVDDKISISLIRFM